VVGASADPETHWSRETLGKRKGWRNGCYEFSYLEGYNTLRSDFSLSLNFYCCLHPVACITSSNKLYFPSTNNFVVYYLVFPLHVSTSAGHYFKCIKRALCTKILQCREYIRVLLTTWDKEKWMVVRCSSSEMYVEHLKMTRWGRNMEKVKVKISLLQAMEAHRVVRGWGSHIT
jgi:hypothetical protein